MTDFETRKAMVTATLVWWRDLFPDNEADDANTRRGNPGALARLRRSATLMDALMEPETHALLRRVGRIGPRSRTLDQRLLLLAMVLPLIKPGEKGQTHFARLLGQTADGKAPNSDTGERAQFSPLRFGALMRATDETDPELLVTRLRRALKILGNAPINTGAFVADLLFLNDTVRKRWAYGYWQTDWPGQTKEPDTVSETASPNPESLQ